jgi:hypothetical protein
LAKVYAYVIFEENQYCFDVAGEFIRNQIRYVLRLFVKNHDESIIRNRFKNIVTSLYLESHSSIFGLTMEDAVLHQLETSEIAKELFYQATNFLVKTTNFKVLRFSEPMDKLVLSKYPVVQHQLLLLLPENEHNEWVDAILVFERSPSRIYVVGIQITISFLTTSKISKTNEFLTHVQKLSKSYRPYVFFICSGAPTNVENYCHFAKIHPDLGGAMDYWIQKYRDQTQIPSIGE